MSLPVDTANHRPRSGLDGDSVEVASWMGLIGSADGASRLPLRIGPVDGASRLPLRIGPVDGASRLPLRIGSTPRT